MSKHEIEIEGLPDGYKAIGVRCGKHQIDHDSNGTKYVTATIFIKPKVRKYDWTQVLPSVLVTFGGNAIYRSIDVDTPYPEVMKISTEWQPNISGRCPVDPEASIVRVKYADGRYGSEVKASTICWSYGYGAATVIAYQVVGLVEGVEW